MKSGVQRRYKAIGDEGCFALCIIQGGNKNCTDWEAYIIIQDAIAKGFLRDDCLVLKQGQFMGMVAGGAWTHTVETASYRPRLGEICIERWAYTDKDGEVHKHFGLRTDEGLWDPLGNSETFEHGECIEKRIFRKT
jgi:hypothetical protein